MELTDLRHFANVAIAGSFGRGALLSHVTAPAVSKSVRKLEDELGARLFERTTRRVSLTPAGRQLLARCERVFAELDSLRAELEARDARVDGELRIGAMEVLSIELLPRALAALMRAHPSLRPITYEMVPDLIATALREGRIEVGLTIGGASADGIDSQELGRSEGVLVCGRSHPLRKQRLVHKADLVQHPSIVPRFLGLEHMQVLDQFPEQEWPRAVGATIELLQMGVRMVEEGAGLGYFPEISVRPQLRDGRLHALRGLPRDRAPFILRALTRSGSPLRPSVRALLDQIAVQIRAITAPSRRAINRGGR